MTGEAGAVPDDVRQLVRDVVRVWLDGTTGGRYTNEVANAVLSVPDIVDAFYAANESEVYVTALGMACADGWSDGASAMDHYIEDARKRLADPADDSDIMPGSEFDGPVVL